jgi:hypothetical protein
MPFAGEYSQQQGASGHDKQVGTCNCILFLLKWIVKIIWKMVLAITGSIMLEILEYRENRV